MLLILMTLTTFINPSEVIRLGFRSLEGGGKNTVSSYEFSVAISERWCPVKAQ